MPSAPRVKKRLIVCCDGTWMDSDHGYVKPSHDHPRGQLQVPSNVTRISRCFKRRCSDGTLQIISYLSGVGTGSTLDTVTGGLFGSGLSEVSNSQSSACATLLTINSEYEKRIHTYAPTTPTVMRLSSSASPAAHLLPVLLLAL